MFYLVYYLSSIFNPQINWLPFSEGFDISSGLNIIFFIPLGIFLPLMWNTFDKLLPTFTIGFLFSFIIEIGQLFTLHRHTDVNDLIMNSLGVIAGWLLVHYLLKWRVRRNENNNTWLIYFIISLGSCFIFG